MRIGSFGYDVHGEGPPLLLLHGFSFDRTLWDDNIAALASHARVIRLDFRGVGESPLASFSIDDLADDAARLLDLLGVPMAYVAGLSMGGYAALAFAARHAVRLSGLILADTRAGADSVEVKRKRDAGIAQIRHQGPEAYATAVLPRLLSSLAPTEMRERALRMSIQAPESMIAALTAMRERPDRQSDLKNICCPALIVVGSEDVITPPDEAAAMARAIPGAELVTIAGAGHLSNLEAPDEFNRALIDFVVR